MGLGTMPRSATSPAELQQIGRVRGLLRGMRLIPSPQLQVTTANTRVHAGWLVRDQMGNNAQQGGNWTYYGAITLLTETGEIEIDYLDIVLIEPRKAASGKKS